MTIRLWTIMNICFCHGLVKFTPHDYNILYHLIVRYGKSTHGWDWLGSFDHPLALRGGCGCLPDPSCGVQTGKQRPQVRCDAEVSWDFSQLCNFCNMLGSHVCIILHIFLRAVQKGRCLKLFETGSRCLRNRSESGRIPVLSSCARAQSGRRKKSKSKTARRSQSVEVQWNDAARGMMVLGCFRDITNIMDSHIPNRPNKRVG